MKQLIHKTSKTIKKSLLILFFATMALTGFAQVAINTDGSSPNSSAMLDVQSSDKGMLIPRMTEAERDAISSPLTGLMVFQTDNTTGFYYYDGSNWKVIGSGAFSIDDLLDGKTGGSNSFFLGEEAGANDDGTDNHNVAIGYSSMNSNTSGRFNTALGKNSLHLNTIGDKNTALGQSALYTNTEGDINTGIGYVSLYKNTTGDVNTATGYASLYSNTTGNHNVAYGSFALHDLILGENNIAIGSGADRYNEGGSNNTTIGYNAGMGTLYHSKSGNIFLGYKAGYNETGDNKLYIENSDSDSPLIYGEFDNDILAVNGNLGVGTQTPGVKLQVVGGTDAILSGGGYLVTGLTTEQNIVMDENEIMARDNGAISAIHLQRDGGAFILHYGLTESNEFVVSTDGKTGIGESSPAAKLHINTISGEDGLRVQIEGATKLKVASNGSVVVGYNATSPTFALQLQPKSYFHHSSETSEDGTFTMPGSQKTFTFGFIAQELNQIIPEAVYVPEDETKNLWAIDYEKLIPVLTKAMQEQQQEIETLKTEIEQMKQMIREQRK